MKLFFIVENDMPHESGGGYYAVFKFAEFLSKRGHSVCIYAVHDLGWITPSENLRLIFRPNIPRKNRFLRKIDKVLQKLSATLILERHINQFKPDWVLGVHTHSAIKATRLGRKLNIRIANFIYESPPWLREAYGDTHFDSENIGYIRTLWDETRSAYLNSDVIFPNSIVSGEYACRWLEGKEVALPVYPGIDEDEMPYGGELHKETMQPNILYVGRLSKQKNVDLLIKAVINSQRKPYLYICGDGEEKDHLINIAGEASNIFFCGFVSDATLWSLYRSCSFVVYPSSFEGFGMPPMQAFYFGKTCLASDIPIFRSIYADYLEYFPLGDLARFSKQIDALLDDPEYCSMRGLAGRNFVLSKFTWKGAAKMIEDVLSNHADQRESI